MAFPLLHLLVEDSVRRGLYFVEFIQARLTEPQEGQRYLGEATPTFHFQRPRIAAALRVPGAKVSSVVADGHPRGPSTPLRFAQDDGVCTGPAGRRGKLPAVRGKGPAITRQSNTPGRLTQRVVRLDFHRTSPVQALLCHRDLQESKHFFLFQA